MFDTIYEEFTGTFGVVPFEVAATRLLAALLLGAVIGFERELRDKPAGLRTNMLVSIAACLFVVVGIEISSIGFGEPGTQQQDPLRLIEAVTAGVAFLAAGLIFTSGGKVRNITTGATLWLSGAVGLACGSGQIPLAAFATVLVVAILSVIRRLETRMGTYDDPDA